MGLLWYKIVNYSKRYNLMGWERSVYFHFNIYWNDWNQKYDQIEEDASGLVWYLSCSLGFTLSKSCLLRCELIAWHCAVHGPEPHLDSVYSSRSLWSTGQCRLWARERSAQLGSPVFQWCRCPERACTATEPPHRWTEWPAASPSDLVIPSMKIPAAVRCLWRRQKKKIAPDEPTSTDCGNITLTLILKH